MRLVGLSGGIACGKSTVTALLRKEGIPVIDCDQLAKDVVRKGRWGWRRVVKAFGTRYLLPNGELDRDALGQLIFSDPAARRRLNHATHLPVLAELVKHVLWHWLTCTWVLVVDMPLLFETGAHKLIRPNVLVSCSPEVQLSRLMTRDGSSVQHASARMAAQMPLEHKARLAQLRLYNDGSMQQLREQVHELAARLCVHATVWGMLTSPLVLLCGGMLALHVARG